MKNKATIPIIIALVSLTAASLASPFTYSYNNVLEPQAGDFIISKQNITNYNEGVESYWCPIVSGSEAILTQKFTFSNPTTAINLDTRISVFSFYGVGSGSGSFWASTDGLNWQLVLDAPTPPLGLSSYYSFNGNLPSSLLGSTELYTQTRLDTNGGNIFAQWGRAADNEPAFALTVNEVPEPANALLLIAGAAFLLLQRRSFQTKRAI